MTGRMTLDQINAEFDGSPYIVFSGMRAVALDHERQEIVLRMPMRPEFERRAGTGQYHGGVIAALIDVAGDFAIAMSLGGGVPTANFRIDYLRPAYDTALTATARVRRAGRTLAVVDIDVTDDSGRLLAVGRGTFMAKPD